MEHPINKPMRSRNQAFSLIEILVVLVIIGITIGIAMLAFGDFGQKRRVALAAEQFINFVKVLQQQAIIETATLGILVQKNRYQALRFDPIAEKWLYTPAKEGLFQQHAFPSRISIELQPRSSGSYPQIVINESGELTPFTMDVLFKANRVAQIVGQHNGLITMNLEHAS